ncbi:uncharacterized protein LOC128556870 [Mercenaria mercenaria]|uniref:uncharacterized protein LOC128556870 n=1 Tax=Mercenaria mercenaria TaxID=6596 RepID=UPI00234F5176|nr:uncharacterized protein LOC128556870 [Mercenaria mercenaria]
MESCWICKAVFQTRKQLKQHAGKEHSILSVICPMCCHKEVHFKRVSDLKVHFLKSHPSESKELDDDAFNESNGFYLSVFPKEYSKLVQKADRLSPSVVRFRTLMIMWAKRLEGKCSKTREELLEGWEVGDDSYVMPLELIDPQLPNTSDDLVINQISLNTSNPHIDLHQGYNKLRVALTNDLFEDKLAMRAIARRLAVLKDAAGHEHFDTSLAETCPELKSSIALKLGIHRSLIKDVHIIKIEMGSKKIKLASDVTDSPALPIETATITSSPSLPAQISNTSNASNSLNSNQHPRSVIVPKRKEPVISTMNSNFLAPQQPKVNNQGYRATKLLRMGAMPLCPPARREWVEDESITLTEGNLTCKWPPKNWKNLSPDQRLLQLEILTFKILQERGVNTSNLERSDILDQFNFLVLPGTKAYCLPDAGKDPTAHSRYHTYATLRMIANSKNIKSEKWLAMLECSSMLRDTTNDKLLRQCDKIPLRI